MEPSTETVIQAHPFLFISLPFPPRLKMFFALKVKMFMVHNIKKKENIGMIQKMLKMKIYKPHFPNPDSRDAHC